MNILIRISFYLILLLCLFSLLYYINKKYPKANIGFLTFLFIYRIPFSYIYLNLLPGDWVGYFSKSKNTSSLLEIFGFGTDGVVLINYPLAKLGLTVLDSFFAFSFAGYVGITIFYVIGHRMTKYTDEVKVWGINLFPWLLLYPSLHMYTVMLGKDPVVILGLALVGFSLLYQNINKWYLLLGLLFLLLVRPHIVFVVVVSLVTALIWSHEMNKLNKATLVILTSIIGIASLPIIFQFFRVGEVSLEAIQLAIQLNESYESSAGTYIDMTAYPFWLKAFTYLYRPLFFDSPNLLLLEYSAENLFFLFLTLSLIRVSFFPWINEQPRILKFCLIFFLIGTLVLSNGLSVFGLFIRQKTMVFLFLIILIISFIHYRNQKVKYSIH